MVLSGTTAFSTTKTGRHDIAAEILLKVALKTKKQNQIKHTVLTYCNLLERKPISIKHIGNTKRFKPCGLLTPKEC